MRNSKDATAWQFSQTIHGTLLQYILVLSLKGSVGLPCEPQISHSSSYIKIYQDPGIISQTQGEFGLEEEWCE